MLLTLYFLQLLLLAFLAITVVEVTPRTTADTPHRTVMMSTLTADRTAAQATADMMAVTEAVMLPSLTEVVTLPVATADLKAATAAVTLLVLSTVMLCLPMEVTLQLSHTVVMDPVVTAVTWADMAVTRVTATSMPLTKL